MPRPAVLEFGSPSAKLKAFAVVDNPAHVVSGCRPRLGDLDTYAAEESLCLVERRTFLSQWMLFFSSMCARVGLSIYLQDVGAPLKFSRVQN